MRIGVRIMGFERCGGIYFGSVYDYCSIMGDCTTSTLIRGLESDELVECVSTSLKFYLILRPLDLDMILRGD